jgi:pimeloyl-ACP methyl ester carboxylesterase
LCALHRSLNAEEVGLSTPLHWKAVIESDASAWLSWSLTSYHRQITAPTLILQAPAGFLTDYDSILTWEEGEQLAIAIPNARLVTVAKADHYTILFRHNPEAIREVQEFLTGGYNPRSGGRRRWWDVGPERPI